MYVRACGPYCEVQTPAKLNLFLEVLGRRNDGFHELETLMVTVSLYDSLECTALPTGDVRLACDWSTGLRGVGAAAPRNGGEAVWDALPGESQNLAWRAVDALRRRAGVEQGAELRLVKRIPAAAGLGGASSDAAAALVAANEAWALGWSRQRLSQIAASLGSDIPFFLEAGGGQPSAAVCRGRGECITVESGIPPLAFVAVRPPAGLSTAEVYRATRPGGPLRSVEPLMGALRRGDLAGIGRGLHNALQPAAAGLSPWIARLEQEFRRLDVVGHAMSGSGSTYFGLCRNLRQAGRIAGSLRGRNCGAVFWGMTGR